MFEIGTIANSAICGIEIIESKLLPKEKPKIQLSYGFKWCTDEFREKQNAHLAALFGHETVVMMIKHPITGADMIMTHPLNVLRIKRAMDNVN